MSVGGHSSGLRDSFFWLFGGNSWRDRFYLLYYWLSPRFQGHRVGRPVAVHTRYSGGKPIYIRSASADVRVLRNIFDRGDYLLPERLVGSVSSVLDLGAYTGLSTVYFAEKHPGARIVAVEPDADNLECLRLNIDQLHAPERIVVRQACVSGSSGIVRFAADRRSWERSISEDGEVELPALTIDELMTQYELAHVDVLKMDIEGAENEVFKSFPSWGSRVGWILVEIHLDSMTLVDLLDALSRSGRRAFVRSRNGWAEVTCPEDCVPGTRFLDVVIPPIALSDQLACAELA